MRSEREKPVLTQRTAPMELRRKRPRENGRLGGGLGSVVAAMQCGQREDRTGEVGEVGEVDIP